MLNKRCLPLICLSLLLLVPLACSRRQTGSFDGLTKRLELDRFRALGLERYWLQDLELDSGVQIEKLWLAKTSIYCLTNQNRLYRIDRDKGVTTWMHQPAAPPRKVRRPVEAQGKTLVIAHNIAKVYNTVSGALLNEFALPFLANSDPAFDGKVFYIANSVDRVIALDLAGQLQLWTARANKTISARPVIAKSSLIAASESGEVLSYSLLTGQAFWPDHFRTRAELLTEPVLDHQGRCYIAGSDSILYCLESSNGYERWRHFAAAPLPLAPVVADDRVFLHVPHSGLLVLNAQSGAVLKEFNCPAGRQYLATINERFYILNTDWNVLSIDAETGRELAKLRLKDFNFFLTNNQTPRLYMADKRGRILCLQKLGTGPLTAQQFSESAQSKITPDN